MGLESRSVQPLEELRPPLGGPALAGLETCSMYLKPMLTTS